MTDATALTVTINGVAAIASGGGLYQAANVVLAEGENEIIIKAVDAAGNENSVDSTLVARDNTPPPPPTLFPLITPTRLAFQTVEGRAESGAQVTITGGVEPVTTEAAFGSGLFAANINLAVGPNILTINVKDTEGNAAPPVQVSITSDPGLALPPIGEAARVNISTGNTQKGLIATELPRPLIAIVTDQAGNPVPNVAVSFVVLEGGGQFVGGSSALNVNTDADGRAPVRYICGAATGRKKFGPALLTTAARRPSFWPKRWSQHRALRRACPASCWIRTCARCRTHLYASADRKHGRARMAGSRFRTSRPARISC